MLLWPHANARYQEAIEPLAEKELLLTLSHTFPTENETFACTFTSIQGLRALTFSAPEADTHSLRALSRHSDLYLLCEYTQDGLLRPLTGAAPAALGSDLSGILKYKGKTNERFTRKMLHMASLCTQVSLRQGERIRFLDPMCGKGTALFEAVNMGFDAYGVDADSASVGEAFQFYKKYLEYHRIKHTQKQSSRTLPQGKSAPVRSILAQNQGEAHFATADATDLPYLFGKSKAHIIAADLPYGVQHAPTAGRKITSLKELAARTLQSCVQALCPGGVVAFSFNTHTLPSAEVQKAMEQAGLTVCQGEAFTGLAHWVEQAVTRDVVFATKTGNATAAERISKHGL